MLNDVADAEDIEASFEVTCENVGTDRHLTVTSLIERCE